MEKKLAEYRARKDRAEKINKIKTTFSVFVDKFKPKAKKTDEVNQISENHQSIVEPLLPQDDEELIEHLDDIVSNPDEDDEKLNCFTYSDLIYYLLWFTLWAILYVIFIELQFGTVYLIVSALIFMYINTRTGPKRPNEISAYSVFNKNCKSIKGTLKAEQFERELIYGPGAIR